MSQLLPLLSVRMLERKELCLTCEVALLTYPPLLLKESLYSSLELWTTAKKNKTENQKVTILLQIHKVREDINEKKMAHNLQAMC